MTVLVTGGAGLIGSHVVDLLAERGETVRVLDALVEPTHQGPPDWLRSDVEYIVGDIRDRRAAAHALEGVDTLVHLAAHTGFVPGTAEYFDVNVTGYARLLEVAGEVTSLKRSVVASTQGVYGGGRAACSRHGAFTPGPRSPEALAARRWDVPCPTCGGITTPQPMDEAHVEPRTPYAVSKLCMEELALRLGPGPGVATTALRFALTYGPRQSPTNPYCGIIALFSQRMRRGEPVLVYEDGSQRRDFVHVTDVARAIVQVLDDPRTHGRVLNVGTGRAESIAGVVGALAELWGVDAKVWMPGWGRPGDARHMVTDATQLRVLGWEPRVTLREGLASYVDWARDRPLPPDPFDTALAEMHDAGLVVS